MQCEMLAQLRHRVAPPCAGTCQAVQQHDVWAAAGANRMNTMSAHHAEVAHEPQTVSPWPPPPGLRMLSVFPACTRVVIFEGSVCSPVFEIRTFSPAAPASP